MQMILAIIQARLGSTRLPGKILMDIAGESILQHVIDSAPEPKIVAMPQSDYLVMGDYLFPIRYYEGDPNDVLGRFYHTWQSCEPNATWILRLTADCPILTKHLVAKFLINAIPLCAPWTIVTNRPRDPDGYDMELFSTKALNLAHEQAHEPYDREHVTPWMYRNLNVTRFSLFDRKPEPEDPAEKVSVDTQEDYEKVKKIMEGR